MAAAIGSALGVWWRRRRGDNSLQRRLRAERQSTQALERAQSALKSQDALTFFIQGRIALQEALSIRLKTPAASLTWPEILRRWPDAPDTLRQWLAKADEVSFAGRGVSANDLPTWYQRLQELLVELRSRS